MAQLIYGRTSFAYIIPTLIILTSVTFGVLTIKLCIESITPLLHTISTQLRGF